MENYFNFNTCDLLIQTLTKVKDRFGIEITTVEDDFDKLRQYFKDEGYDTYNADMRRMLAALKDVILQMQNVLDALEGYSYKLRKVVEDEGRTR